MIISAPTVETSNPLILPVFSLMNVIFWCFILLRFVESTSTAAYGLPASAQSRISFMSGKLSDRLSLRAIPLDSEEHDPIFQMDEDEVAPDSPPSPFSVGEWNAIEQLIPDALACIQMKSSLSDCQDADFDFESSNRPSYSSDPDSIQGNGNRDLSPSLTTTIISWDFDFHSAGQVPELPYAPVPQTVTFLSKTDLDKLRQLGKPPQIIKRGTKTEPQARSLPSDISSNCVANKNGANGAMGRFEMARSVPSGESLDSASFRHSVMRGYHSDGRVS